MIGHQLAIDTTTSIPVSQGPGLCPTLHNYSRHGNLRQDAGLVAMPDLNRCHTENDKVRGMTSVREMVSMGKSFCVYEDLNSMGYVAIEENASEQQCAQHFHSDSINQIRPLYVSPEKTAMCASPQSCDAQPIHPIP